MTFPENVIRIAFPTLWNVFIRVHRRLGRSAKRTKASESTAIERLGKAFEREAAPSDSIDDEYEVIEHAANWLFSTPRSDAEFEFLFGLSDDDPGAVAGRQQPLILVSENLRCPSTWWYYDLQEALAARRFRRMEDTPYPTAPLRHKRAYGRAQLRPLIADAAPLLSPEAEQYWIERMWKQREELSDLDADVLDCLSARWLDEAKDPNDTTLVEVDDILKMRGLRPKISGQGRRCGYRPEQRAAIVRSIEHLENVWFDLFKIQVYPRRASGRRSTPVYEPLQSRAVVITDRVGQLDLVGGMEVHAVVFRPGQVFSYFLFGPGRQIALLSSQTVKYPLAKKLEKRLARYLSWQWRIKARNSEYLRPYRITTLLQAIDMETPRRNMSRVRERVEKALDTLEDDQIIAAWQYGDWEEPVETTKVGAQPRHAVQFATWQEGWLNALVWIEPPDSITQHYRGLFANYREKTGRNDSLSETVEGKRTERRLTRLRLCEALEISPPDLMRIEGGRPVSQRARKKVEVWLGQLKVPGEAS